MRPLHPRRLHLARDLGLQALDGKIGDAILTAPAAFGFELDGRRVLFADQSGALPHALSRRGYDLCFPMSAIPLGRLRREFPKWREDRRYRTLAVLPLLLPDLAEIWPKHAEELRRIFAPIDSLYALQPAQSLWYKPFAEWTSADWQHPGHKSLFWNISTGAVATYPGVRDRPPNDVSAKRTPRKRKRAQ